MNHYPRQQHISFLDLVWRFKGYLALYIIGVSFLTFVGLYLIGGVPDELKVSDSTTTNDSLLVGPQIAASDLESTTQTSTIIPKVQSTTPTNLVQGELPTRISIAKIGVNVLVTNTATTNNDVLNQDLLKGSVRYPGSGTLGHGNMFIFAHSTGIKIVNNQAYKAFNNLDKLNIGDVIKVQSATKVYTYKVTSVRLADSSEQFVNLQTNKNMLTLTTCDVFGEKQQRFVVEAEFVQ